MCTVSAVTGTFQQYKPLRPWTPEAWSDIKKILALCERIDRSMGEPDCIDPAKEEWMRRMSDMYDEAKEQAKS